MTGLVVFGKEQPHEKCHKNTGLYQITYRCGP